MTALSTLLRPQVLTKVISQQTVANDSILRHYGMQPGGPNESHMGHGRHGAYHIYNHVRSVGKGRGPGTAAAKSKRNPVGRVPFVYPRMHDSIELLAEEMHNLGQISDPRMRDEAGRDYISRQTKTLAEKGRNWRLAQVIGMMRDELYVTVDGDDWYFDWDSTGNLFRINFNMPAGNKTQLNMLGAGNIIDISWANVTTANIPKHLGGINAAWEQLNGGSLTDAFLNWNMWDLVVRNDFVQAQAGTASPPFTVLDRVIGTRPDGSQIVEHIGKIASNPGVSFHINDSGLELGENETFRKYFPDNKVAFGQSPDRGIYNMMTGSEPIAEYDGGPKTVKVGMAAWSTESSNPTSTNIFELDNALAVNHVPSSNAIATVVF